MKYLYLLLLFSTFCFGQKKGSDLSKAQYFLKNDPCDGTGLGWAKSSLKREPNNSSEAKKIIDNCNNITYNNAINNITSNSISDLENLIKLEEFNTTEANKVIATYYYKQSGASHVVESYLDKVLVLDPNDLESRWMRVECNMMSNSNLEDFEKAANDLIYISENGGASAKIYANLGLVYQKIAKDWEIAPIKVKSTYHDDNSAEVIKKQNLAKAVENLKNSNLYYLKSLEINDTYKKKVDFEVKDNNLSIDRFSK